MKVYIVFKQVCHNMCDYEQEFDSVHASSEGAEKRLIGAKREVSKESGETAYIREETLNN